MKLLTLIVPAASQLALADVLRVLPGVEGFTFSPAEGHGPVREEAEQWTVRDQVVGYIPRVRVELLLEERVVDSVLAAVRAPGLGIAGRSHYWLTEPQRGGHL